MKSKLEAALAAARASAKREIGLFVGVMIFALIVALVATPIILLFSLLPDWAWLVLFVAGVIWMIFGETISAAINAYRGEKP